MIGGPTSVLGGASLPRALDKNDMLYDDDYETMFQAVLTSQLLDMMSR